MVDDAPQNAKKLRNVAKKCEKWSQEPPKRRGTIFAGSLRVPLPADHLSWENEGMSILGSRFNHAGGRTPAHCRRFAHPAEADIVLLSLLHFGSSLSSRIEFKNIEENIFHFQARVETSPFLRSTKAYSANYPSFSELDAQVAAWRQGLLELRMRAANGPKCLPRRGGRRPSITCSMSRQASMNHLNAFA